MAEWTGLEPATPGVTGRDLKSMFARFCRVFSYSKNYHGMPIIPKLRALFIPKFSPMARGIRTRVPPCICAMFCASVRATCDSGSATFRPCRTRAIIAAMILRTIILAAAVAIAGIADARPHRSAAVVLAFKRHHPCPSTGLRRGACPGWQVDHAQALCAGGPDAEENLQWLSIEAHREKTRQDVRVCRALRKDGQTEKGPPG